MASSKISNSGPPRPRSSGRLGDRSMLCSDTIHEELHVELAYAERLRQVGHVLWNQCFTP